MKKFITLPYDVYEQLMRSNECPEKNILLFDGNASSKTTTDYTEIPNTEAKLNDILNSKLSEDKKRTLYTDVLRRYIDLHDTTRQDTGSINNEIYDPLPILTDILPKTIIKKGVSFLNYLSSNSEISWDKIGTVSINNRVIHGSNLIDLIAYTVRNTPNRPEPVGFKIFNDWLVKQNVPITFIGNTSVINQILLPSIGILNNTPLGVSSSIVPGTNKPIRGLKAVKRKIKWSPF